MAQIIQGCPSIRTDFQKSKLYFVLIDGNSKTSVLIDGHHCMSNLNFHVLTPRVPHADVKNLKKLNH